MEQQRNDTVVFIRYVSHRARHRLYIFLERKPTSYYSLRRPCTYGIGAITPEEEAQLRKAKVKGWTRLRGPYEDLCQCWE